MKTGKERTGFSTNRIAVLFIVNGSECLDLFSDYLETKNRRFLIDRAASVDEALEKLEKSDYSVLIGDNLTLGIDGLRLLEELRKQGNKIPFILFSGEDRKDDLICILNLERSQFIRKNSDQESDFNNLADTIANIVESRECGRNESLKPQTSYGNVL